MLYKEVLPRYFLVKINKEKQRYFKQHVSINSPIYVPPTNVHETKNMENGIVVQIGKDVADLYEGLKIGMVMILHWRIEADDKKTGEQFYLYEDDTWVYYCVPSEHTRGYWNGKTVIPHPKYVFLKNVSALPEQGEYDELSRTYLKKNDFGILTFSTWKDSPLDIAGKVEELKKKIQSLTKNKPTAEIQSKINELEKERQDLNRKSQKAAYLPYKVAYSSNALNTMLGREIKEDDILLCLNKGCLYLTNFQLDPSYKYIIASIEHVGFMYSQIRDAVRAYNEKEMLVANEYA